MIKFDTANVEFEFYQLKNVTTALGGSILVVDGEDKTGKPTYKRIPTPMAVARAFIKKTDNTTKYLKPTWICAVKYESRIVALERHPLSSLGELYSEGVFDEHRRWTPDCENNFRDLVAPAVDRGDRVWYFDGRYVFSFENGNMDAVIHAGTFLTESGAFRKVTATALDMQELSNTGKLSPKDRSCLAFVTSTGKYVVSAPIWKNLSEIGTTQIKKSGARDTDDVEDEEVDADITTHLAAFPFNEIDKNLSVNLNFALKAGGDIGRIFGYEKVEPLQLARLMVELHTVNLPSVAPHIKQTFDIGMKFTHATAWLLGLMNSNLSLDNYVAMGQLLKYLTKKGIFRSNVFDADRVFKEGQSIEAVPVKKLDELIANKENTMSIQMMMMMARRDAKARIDGDLHAVGGLVNEFD